MVRRNHDKQTYVMVCINRETVIYKCHGSQKPRQLLQKVYRFGGQNWILGGYKRTMGGRKRNFQIIMDITTNRQHNEPSRYDGITEIP
jgi:hypothetical protein